MESIHLNQNASKAEKYKELLPQIKALLDSDVDLIANMANLCAVLKTSFNWLWVGFYRVQAEQLVLGPFQGPLACTSISKGAGVCGTSWESNKTIIVPNVDDFAGHIACSPLSKSEIVLPLHKNGTVLAVLDIDADSIACFDLIDQQYLEEILVLLAKSIK